MRPLRLRKLLTAWPQGQQTHPRKKNISPVWLPYSGTATFPACNVLFQRTLETPFISVCYSLFPPFFQNAKEDNSLHKYVDDMKAIWFFLQLICFWFFPKSLFFSALHSLLPSLHIFAFPHIRAPLEIKHRRKAFQPALMGNRVERPRAEWCLYSYNMLFRLSLEQS